MNTKRRKAAVIICLVLVLLVSVGFVSLSKKSKTSARNFKKSEAVTGNPLIGYAPQADHPEITEDINLLYMDITWRELEPQEGVFDWAKIEAENHLQRWREEGKHLVFRFICDIPRDETHMDIPDWLYEKIGQQGTWYDMSYGKGFSPDYNNQILIDYHEKAITALGQHFGQDGFIAYIELGSLGHWGEWHVNYSAGITRLPVKEVREQYIKPYITAFPHAMVMMRRPFSAAKTYGLGLFNDMTGEPDSTAEWLDWITNGGDFNQVKERGELVPMTEAWKTDPIGGEMTSALSMEDMLQENLPRTVKMIQDSHMTFIGPKIAEIEFKQGYDEVLNNLGYQIWIHKAELHMNGANAELKLHWVNDGNAPFYQEWPVFVAVIDKNGKVIEEVPVAISLPELLPGSGYVTTSVLTADKISRWEREGMKIALGIVDPMTGKPAVRFVMEAGQEDGRVILFE